MKYIAMLMNLIRRCIYNYKGHRFEFRSRHGGKVDHSFENLNTDNT